MQDIPQQTLNETTAIAQQPNLDLWELDLTLLGGERLFFCAEPNEKGEGITWQGQLYHLYPVSGDGFEASGSGAANRPTLKVSNLFGAITALAEDYDGLGGARVVRRQVYSCFLDAINFFDGNPQASAGEEVVSRYEVEQLTALTDEDAAFTLSIPSETDGAEFPSRVMLADVCSWGYRSDECGYVGPAVADEFDNPTTDPAQDKCGKCRRSCEMRGNIGSFGGFLSIGKLSQ